MKEYKITYTSKGKRFAEPITANNEQEAKNKFILNIPCEYRNTVNIINVCEIA